MAKVTLGAAPKTVSRKVEFKIAGGDTAHVTIEYRYRTRSQYAEYLAKLYPQLSPAVVAAEAEKAKTAIEFPELPQPEAPAFKGLDFVADTEASIQADITQILEIATGWDLSEPFDAANLRTFVDEYPLAPEAVKEGYYKALSEAGEKN